MCVPCLVAGDKSDRAEQLKAIQADYRTARDELFKAIRAGKVKAAKDGSISELAELQQRAAKRTRELIDAGPKDAVALDAILFSMRELVADAADPKLYDLLLAHHAASPELGSVVTRPRAGEPFLREVIAKSPHAEVRGRATLALANRLARADGPREAETLCEQILKDKELAKLYRGADDLLFEIRHLQVGKVVPEVEGVDLDDKPMKLSEYRGKAVMVVFWATWCVPCMKMVPHERELTKRYAGQPFAIVGINGDGEIRIGPKGEQIDERPRLKGILKMEQITWRSFKNYLPKEKRQISHRWNVVEWPTVFLIDHEGRVRHVFRGTPEEAGLDAAIEKLVAAAKANAKEPAKR
jgi:thiol-disulfide isomerase/thioredoxin